MAPFFGGRDAPILCRRTQASAPRGRDYVRALSVRAVVGLSSTNCLAPPGRIPQNDSSVGGNGRLAAGGGSRDGGKCPCRACLGRFGVRWLVAASRAFGRCDVGGGCCRAGASTSSSSCSG